MTTLVLIGLASFWVTQLVKTVLPWPFEAWTKQLIPLAVGAGAVVLLDLDIQVGVITAVASAGLAAFIHRIHRWAGAAGDQAQVSVVTMAGRRPRL